MSREIVHSVDAAAVMQSCRLDVKVTGTNGLGLRVAVGTHLLKLAAWVFGTQLDVTFTTDVPGAKGVDVGRVDEGLPLASDCRAGDFDFALFQGVDFLVNAQPMLDVVAYDVPAGWLECHVHNEAGKVVVGMGRHSIATVRLYGRVDVWKHR